MNSDRFVKTNESWTRQNISSKTYFCLNVLSCWNQNILQKCISFTDSVYQRYRLCHVLPKFLASLSFTWDRTAPSDWKSSPDTVFPSSISTRPEGRGRTAISCQRLAPPEWEGPSWLPGLQEASDAFTLDTSCTSCKISPPCKALWKNHGEEWFYLSALGFMLACNPKLFPDEPWAYKEVVFQWANHLLPLHCERY